MNKTVLSIAAAAAVASAIAVPTIAAGNARRAEGSLADLRAAETPYIADLSGANEVPTAGDPDATGAATVSFDDLDGGQTQVCWDMAYADLAAPTAAHIHQGAAGTNGPVVFNFGTPTPNSFSGCLETDTSTITPILANPAGFYVNVHNSEYPGGAIRGQLAEGPETAGSAHLLPTPLRAYDSREDAAGLLPVGEERTVSLRTGLDESGDTVIAVPPGATAAIVTLTATDTDGPGFLVMYSAASPKPATSNLNFAQVGDIVAVSTQVVVDETGSVKVSAGASGTHFVIDVVGYLY